MCKLTFFYVTVVVFARIGAKKCEGSEVKSVVGRVVSVQMSAQWIASAAKHAIFGFTINVNNWARKK